MDDCGRRHRRLRIGSDRDLTGSRRRVSISAALIVLTQSVQYLAIGGLALFLPVIRHDLGLSFTQAGTVAASSNVTYAVMQIPAGVLSDRLGARRVFLAGLLGTSALVVSLALIRGYGPLVANQAAAGFFRALAFAPGLVLIARLFPENRRATAVGLFVAGGFAANVAVNAVGPRAVDSIGWREIFVAFGVAGMVVLLLVWRTTRGRGDLVGAASISLSSAVATLKHRLMWLAATIQFVRLAVAGGLAFWLPSILVADKGLSLQGAGAVVAVGAAMTAVSNFAGGYLSDRLHRPTLVIGASLITLAFANLALARTADRVIVVVLVVLISFLVQIYFGPLFALPIQALRLKDPGFATGFGNFFANLGGVSSVYLLGTLRDASGSFAAGLDLLAVLCACGLVPLWFIRRNIANPTHPTEPSEQITT